MHADQTPFRPGWWSIALRQYRPCDDTYCLFPYDSLPPIDPTSFRGDFHWLPPLDPALRDVGAVDEKRAEIARHLPALIAEAGTRGVTLPAAFLAFMRDQEAHRRVPTCTACYFDLPVELTPSPFGDEAYLIRFLNDQQWCSCGICISSRTATIVWSSLRRRMMSRLIGAPRTRTQAWPTRQQHVLRSSALEHGGAPRTSRSSSIASGWKTISGFRSPGGERSPRTRRPIYGTTANGRPVRTSGRHNPVS